MVSEIEIEFIKERIKDKSRIEAIRIMRKYGLSCREMRVILKET